MIQIVRIQSRICVGGPALNSILLSQGLSRAQDDRYDTTLVGGGLEDGERSMEAFAEARGVPIKIISKMRRSVSPRQDAQALLELVQLLRRIRPTIVHTHTAKAGALGRLAAKMAGVPIVLHTFHGHVFEGYFSPRKAEAFAQIERGLARITDKILAISAQQKEDLALKYKIAPAEKIHVIPLGVELERFFKVDREDLVARRALRAELEIDEAAPLIVTVGRLVPIKRFDLLLEAFRLVLQRLPKAQLLIAGDGECREALERQASAMSAQVRFVGWRSDAERLYQAADCFALTSDNEGTPVAVIEALTAGLSVVATRVGGVEDVLLSEEAGELVEPRDVQAIANALIRRLTSPAHLSQQLRSEVFRRYSHRRLIGDMRSLYDQLYEAHQGRVSLPWRALRRGA